MLYALGFNGILVVGMIITSNNLSPGILKQSLKKIN
jgi:hypothetical protein